MFKTSFRLLLAGLPWGAGAAPHAWTIADIATPDAAAISPAATDRRPDSILSKDYAALVLEDAKHVFSSPLHWDRRDWMVAGGLTGLVLGAGAFDQSIKEESQEHVTPRLNNFTREAQRFGSEGSWLTLGLFEAYGYLADDSEAKAVAMDGLTASIIAAGVITPALKFAVGRKRPNSSDHTFEAAPFSGNYSFPSGHTTQAFAVASVIAAHYPQWWVQGVAYGLAGVVGYSRIQQNAHFASDVVAGAIIGTVVGRTIVKRHDTPRPGAFVISPYFDGGASGLIMSRDF